MYSAKSEEVPRAHQGGSAVFEVCIISGESCVWEGSLTGTWAGDRVAECFQNTDFLSKYQTCFPSWPPLKCPNQNCGLVHLSSAWSGSGCWSSARHKLGAGSIF